MARKSTSRSIRDRGPAGQRRLAVGVVRGAHGTRGEVRVAPDTDHPRRFAVGGSVHLEGVGDRRIVRRRGTAAEPILLLEGIADRESAQGLSGRVLSVPIEEARAQVAGYLWADLVGLRVEDEHGAALGTLEEVLRPGGEADVFLVRTPGGGELLLPAIESVIRAVELERGRIVVRPQEEAR